MELWRRVFLVFGILGAVSLFMWVSLKPVVLVDLVDFVEEQENQSQWTERGLYLAQLPLEDFISEITKDKVLQVEGPVWEAFFDGVTAASTGWPEAGKDWVRHIPSNKRDWDYSTRTLFFRRNDSPMDQIVSHFTYDLQQSYIFLSRNGKKDYLELTYRNYGHNNFLLGSGFNSTKPPDYMFHPYRPLSLVFLLAGLALYLLLPGPKRKENAVFYPRWRLIIGDILTLLVTVPFFTLAHPDCRRNSAGFHFGSFPSPGFLSFGRARIVDALAYGMVRGFLPSDSPRWTGTGNNRRQGFAPLYQTLLLSAAGCKAA